MRHRISDRHIFEYLPVASIIPYAANPREHPPEQIAMLRDGIERYGFNAPVLVTPDRELIAGHGRLLAAKELGMETVPAIVLADLSEPERRAYRIADNAIALKGSWSIELLNAEVSFLVESEFDFDAGDLGFETGELDFALSQSTKRSKTEPQLPLVDRSREPISRDGDLWTVGRHRILCGDARLASSFEALMGSERAQVVVSDMPWNLSADMIGGNGRIKHPDFAMARGEMSRDAFREFMQTVFEHQAAFSIPGSLHYQFIDWRGVADMIGVGEAVYDALVNLCVWVKPNGGMGAL